jgi:hypothetical protein
MRLTDESTIGGWLGGIFAISAIAYCTLGWIPIDRWLQRHHHEYITTEVRELLQSGGWPPIIFMALVGAVLGGCLFVAGFHFFYQRGV